MLGVFMARDFLLFFVCWELVLVPMYFIIAIWGGTRRIYAAFKFIIYTLVGSVVMMLAFWRCTSALRAVPVLQLRHRRADAHLGTGGLQWWVFWRSSWAFA